MNLTPIKLGKDRIAHVYDEITFGQYEDSLWVREVFFKDIPEHSRALYTMASLVMVSVVKWEGMGEDWEWPEMTFPLSTDQPALKKRIDTLKSLNIHSINKIFEFINNDMEVDPKLEGN